MSSIITNNSAMVALQTLKSINANLSDTQNEIATGKNISSAKDNSAIWAISKVMEADVAGFDAVSKSLAVGEATLGVASAGAESIVETLKEMEALAVSGGSETADFTKIQAEMLQKVAQIADTIEASQFNGVNLLSTAGNGLTVVSSVNRVGNAAATTDTIAVANLDFEANIDTAGMTAITDSATAATAFGEIQTMLTTALAGASTIGSAASRVEDQGAFVSKLSDSLKSGIGALVDADMEAASARLQALQTQQQLGVQALSIANQAPQTILSLFR
ncbi:flagellin [Sulfitobacter sp. M57]|uniref:flagellin N-terminal helical domain-containing protein n=1 Tax=unclassified Sulfitobacter TaxID=196795 RepID=UPI0023E0DFEB|nr:MULTISPECIES: flagellin [unclassified Sulfitobacter]MDF3415193.1 flagellin [Sulfitobacter sp. KE5]MDF3422674.1 flagellin [Sulfitobacter sp. KE43]MDF3433739.1 flagellin [Sulfitobacter sp. KE42]MDF3459379.1 flagellin [Sulfitobacter sp. S74]MDF3463278.1 flagellin [Sulfitobacter sp. Ks18]